VSVADIGSGTGVAKMARLLATARPLGLSEETLTIFPICVPGLPWPRLSNHRVEVQSIIDAVLTDQQVRDFTERHASAPPALSTLNRTSVRLSCDRPITVRALVSSYHELLFE